jgi:hypothetical protein
MLSGRSRGVKIKFGHSAGGARAGFGRKRLDSAISQAIANSTAGELGEYFLYLTAVN